MLNLTRTHNAGLDQHPTTWSLNPFTLIAEPIMMLSLFLCFYLCFKAKPFRIPVHVKEDSKSMPRTLFNMEEWTG
jgi:hypothetical protein